MERDRKGSHKEGKEQSLLIEWERKGPYMEPERTRSMYGCRIEENRDHI